MAEAAGPAGSSPLVGAAAEPTLRDLSVAGRRAWTLPPLDVPDDGAVLPEAATGTAMRLTSCVSR